MVHPEDHDPGSEDWNPEKDKKQEKLLERAMELMEKESARAEEHHAGRVVGALDYFPRGNQIAIRRIKNGFIMTYFEAKGVPQGPVLVVVPGAYFPKEVEVSFKTAAEGIPHFVAAIDNAELLAKSAALIEAAAAEQMKVAAKMRGGGPFGPIRPATDPEPLRPVSPFEVPPAAEPVAAPDDETKRLEDPPPASPS